MTISLLQTGKKILNPLKHIYYSKIMKTNSVTIIFRIFPEVCFAIDSFTQNVHIRWRVTSTLHSSGPCRLPGCHFRICSYLLWVTAKLK